MTVETSDRPGKTGNRQRLIEAALDAIAERGFAAASVSEIVTRAGLSRGMVHLHFEDKDALIAEAARHASDVYYAQLGAHLSAASPGPTGIIRAVVACDLSDAVMNARTVGIWYELRGAARTSPAIAVHSDTRGGRLEEVLIKSFRALAARANDSPGALAQDAMRGTIALLDGIWTDFMLHPKGYDAGDAQRVIFLFLNGLFPGQFVPPGTGPGLHAKLTAQFDPPRLSLDVVAALLADHYGLAGGLRPLSGEREQNLRLDGPDGCRYVVKIARASDAPGAIAFQTRVLRHLAGDLAGRGIPAVHFTKGGEPIVRHGAPASDVIELRVLDYVAGQPVADGDAPTPALARDAGRLLGATSVALARLDTTPPPAFMPWNIENGLLDDPALWALGQADIGAREADLRARYQRLLPGLMRQRMQVIHGDAHLENLLRMASDADDVSGLIDFGDMSVAPLVCDAAILALGFAENASDPAAMAAAAVAGYHSTCPLTGGELDLIHEAMVARQALSVLLLDAKLSAPGLRSEALYTMRAGLMDRLGPLAELDGARVTAAIRAACGVSR